MREKRYGETVVKIYADTSALVEATTEYIVETLRSALAARDTAYLSISGGSTPQPVFARLAVVKGVDWGRVKVCFVDERNVPPNDAASNYGMAKSIWFDSGTVPEQNILRMKGELNADVAAKQYEAELRGLKMPLRDGFPVFDLIWLGMGTNGHCASLFPGSPALAEKVRWVTGNWVEELHMHRITMTYPVLNHARKVMFMVSGTDKAKPLAEVLSGGSDLPSAGVHPKNGELAWLVDEAAAGSLA